MHFTLLVSSTVPKGQVFAQIITVPSSDSLEILDLSE